MYKICLSVKSIVCSLLHFRRRVKQFCLGNCRQFHSFFGCFFCDNAFPHRETPETVMSTDQFLIVSMAVMIQQSAQDFLNLFLQELRERLQSKSLLLCVTDCVFVFHYLPCGSRCSVLIQSLCVSVASPAPPSLSAPLLSTCSLVLELIRPVNKKLGCLSCLSSP